MLQHLLLVLVLVSSRDYTMTGSAFIALAFCLQFLYERSPLIAVKDRVGPWRSLESRTAIYSPRSATSTQLPLPPE